MGRTHTKHHFVPKQTTRRLGLQRNDRRNKIKLRNKIHRAWHYLFDDLPPEDALLLAVAIRLYCFAEEHHRNDLGYIGNPRVHELAVYLLKQSRKTYPIVDLFTAKHMRAFCRLFSVRHPEQGFVLMGLECMVAYIITNFFPDHSYYEEYVHCPLIQELYRFYRSPHLLIPMPGMAKKRSIPS